MQDDRFSIDGLGSDLKGFTLKSETNLRPSSFVGPEGLKAFGPVSTTISGSIWPAHGWETEDFQVVMREPIILPWYRALWHKLRGIPVPTVEAIRFVGTPQGQRTHLDDDEVQTTLEFTARDVVFTVVPDYSWRHKAFVAWLRVARMFRRVSTR